MKYFLVGCICNAVFFNYLEFSKYHKKITEICAVQTVTIDK